RDFGHGAVGNRSCCRIAPSESDRRLVHVRLPGFGRHSRHKICSSYMNELPVKPKHIAVLGTTKLSRALRYRFKHRPRIGRRPTDDTQNLTDSSLVFQRLGQLSLSCLLGLEQPRVLNGDDSLIGEGLKQCDLPVREGLHDRWGKENYADLIASTEERHAQHGTCLRLLLTLVIGKPGI